MMLRTLSGVERLEVQARARVEVGGHGLRVGVDHHRAPARAAEDVRRLDGAVVELDPLPDPDRAAADDERGGARRGRRLGRRAGRRVGRVEVRRLGRELRGAGVDHRVARARGRAPRRAARTAVSGTPASPAEVAVGEARPAWRSRGAGARRSSAASTSDAPAAPHVVLERDVAAHLREEPRADPGRRPDDLLRARRGGAGRGPATAASPTARGTA